MLEIPGRLMYHMITAKVEAAWEFLSLASFVLVSSSLYTRSRTTPRSS